jgi:hypothetical protein
MAGAVELSCTVVVPEVGVGEAGGDEEPDGDPVGDEEPDGDDGGDALDGADDGTEGGALDGADDGTEGGALDGADDGTEGGALDGADDEAEGPDDGGRVLARRAGLDDPPVGGGGAADTAGECPECPWVGVVEEVEEGAAAYGDVLSWLGSAMAVGPLGEPA